GGHVHYRPGDGEAEAGPREQVSRRPPRPVRGPGAIKPATILAASPARAIALLARADSGAAPPRAPIVCAGGGAGRLDQHPRPAVRSAPPGAHPPPMTPMSWAWATR